MLKRFTQFILKLTTAKPTFQIGLTFFLFFLFFLPGQNDIQTLKLTPQPPKVKASTISINPSSYPIANPNTKIPSLTAKAAIVIDVDSASILLTKNADSRLMPASTTKIMTAMVALEEYNLDDIVTIKNEDRSIGHTAELNQGEKLTVKQLLYATLVSSGNDAALALAQFHPQNYSGFVAKMNQKAQQLHLENTHFTNVSGVEQYNHYTSARDLALLTKEALKNPIFAQIVATKQITLTSQTGQTHHLKNINQLLGSITGIQGVKTGWTERAGECLVTAATRNNHQIITVILGSTDRFGESRLLIDWAYSNHNWQQPNI